MSTEPSPNTPQNRSLTTPSAGPTPDPDGRGSGAQIQGSAAPVDLEGDTTLRCHCWWRGERCANRATAEDGLCNWCGNGRPEHMLRKDPNALVINDTFYGIGGAGQLHDSRPGSPGACWYSDSDREVR